MSDDIKVTESSGNVFADLGYADPEEALAKAELARRISQIITKRHLTQAQAAEILGVDQPKVSNLMRGKLSGFSTDRLFKFLNALGRDVKIVIEKPKARTRQHGHTRVVTA
jgi:predicted XRE-type DNA-binding protein